MYDYTLPDNPNRNFEREVRIAVRRKRNERFVSRSDTRLEQELETEPEPEEVDVDDIYGFFSKIRDETYKAKYDEWRAKRRCLMNRINVEVGEENRLWEETTLRQAGVKEWKRGIEREAEERAMQRGLDILRWR
jgi:hypothetical protein